MAGRRSPPTPSTNRLTSLPDSVLSKCRRSRHAEFQHIKRRHHRSSLCSLFREGMENENPALLGQSGAPGTLLPVRKGRRAPLRQHAGRARGFKRNPARAGSGRLKRAGSSGALRRVLPSNFCLKGSARATPECARGSSRNIRLEGPADGFACDAAGVFRRSQLNYHHHFLQFRSHP